MKEPAPINQIFISKLTEIILDNLGNENFGVKELAQESGMSRYVLTRKLFAITNKTPNQIIREVRLKKALEILSNESTISEVATNDSVALLLYIVFMSFLVIPREKLKIKDLKVRKKTSYLLSLLYKSKKELNGEPLFLHRQAF
jgi:hypothetical protein